VQTNEDKIATAQQLKEEGNSFVKQQDYGKALLAYHKVSAQLIALLSSLYEFVARHIQI
jgi:hypothetical protein